MNTYPAMNEQIVDVLRWSDNPASLYAAARIEELEAERKELEAERDALAGVLGDANELHGEVRAELDDYANRIIELESALKGAKNDREAIQGENDD